MADVRSIHRCLARGMLDEQELEDRCQATLLALWEKRARFNGGRSRRAWIHGFCMNEVAKDLARRRRLPRAFSEFDVQFVSDEGDRMDGIHDDVRLELHAALKRIGSSESEIVRLKFRDGLSFRQIASRLGQPQSSVKSRYYVGLERLNARLPHLCSEVEDPRRNGRPRGPVSEVRGGRVAPPPSSSSCTAP